MRIIKTSTYNRLVANGRNLDLLTEKYHRLEVEHKAQSERNDHLKSELNRLGDKVVAQERQLNKYLPRLGQGGKFQKKDN